MAAEFQNVLTTQEVQGGKLVKVREWGYTSEPSGVYFQFRTLDFVTKADSQLTADQIDQTLESILGNAAITDIAYSQDVTPSGMLQDIYTVYFTADGGKVSGFVEVPYSRFTPAFVLGDVSNAIGTF